MSIDPSKVKAFWDSRAARLDQIPFESLTNLEENPELMRLKMGREREKVSRLLRLSPNDTLLDLGAGTGNWSGYLAPFVGQVHSVEYSARLVDLGRAKMQEQGLANVTFFHSPAQKFRSDLPYDVIFISGLFVYLADEECRELMRNLPSYSKPSTTLFLRDGTGVDARHEINNNYSEILKTHYSAVYRTREEYAELMEGAGYQLEHDENMFDDGFVLNKFSETRLRVYVFRRRA